VEDCGNAGLNHLLGLKVFPAMMDVRDARARALPHHQRCRILRHRELGGLDLLELVCEERSDMHERPPDAGDLFRRAILWRNK
jgi:hypothetical protein